MQGRRQCDRVRTDPVDVYPAFLRKRSRLFQRYIREIHTGHYCTTSRECYGIEPKMTLQLQHVETLEIVANRRGEGALFFHDQRALTGNQSSRIIVGILAMQLRHHIPAFPIELVISVHAFWFAAVVCI